MALFPLVSSFMILMIQFTGSEFLFRYSPYLIPSGIAILPIFLSIGLSEKIRQLKIDKERALLREKRYKEKIRRDEMTGLYNKGYFNSRFPLEVDHACSIGQPFSVILFDIDNFKNINDTYGHSNGDVVLNAMAEIIQQETRKRDIPCRFGGEEIIILLPDTEQNEAFSVADKIKNRFDALKFEANIIESKSNIAKIIHILKPNYFQCTFSVGIAQLKGNETSEELFKRADAALYKVKNSGKNDILIG